MIYNYIQNPCHCFHVIRSCKDFTTDSHMRLAPSCLTSLSTFVRKGDGLSFLTQIFAIARTDCFICACALTLGYIVKHFIKRNLFLLLHTLT
jgi:hypothetical protein